MYLKILEVSCHLYSYTYVFMKILNYFNCGLKWPLILLHFCVVLFFYFFFSSYLYVSILCNFKTTNSWISTFIIINLLNIITSLSITFTNQMPDYMIYKYENILTGGQIIHVVNMFICMNMVGTSKTRHQNCMVMPI